MFAYHIGGKGRTKAPVRASKHAFAREQLELLRRCHASNKKKVRRDLKEIGCEGANWVHLTEARVQWQARVDTLMIL
jgi:hypothetical protein